MIVIRCFNKEDVIRTLNIFSRFGVRFVAVLPPAEIGGRDWDVIGEKTDLLPVNIESLIDAELIASRNATS